MGNVRETRELYKTLKISDRTHDILKRYCKLRGKKMNIFVDNLVMSSEEIKEFLEKLKVSKFR